MYNPPPPFYSPPSPFNHQIHTKEHAADARLKSVKTKQLDVAKDLKSQMAWLSSSEAKQRADAAKAQALSEFQKRFPSTDISRFQEEVEFDSNRKATATLLFTESNGSQTDPLIKTVNTGHNLAKTLWEWTKMVAFLFNYHCL